MYFKKKRSLRLYIVKRCGCNERSSLWPLAFWLVTMSIARFCWSQNVFQKKFKRSGTQSNRWCVSLSASSSASSPTTNDRFWNWSDSLGSVMQKLGQIILRSDLVSKKFLDLGNIVKTHEVRSTKLGQPWQILDLVRQSGHYNIKGWPDHTEIRSGFEKIFWPREHSHILKCEVDKVRSNLKNTGSGLTVWAQ